MLGSTRATEVISSKSRLKIADLLSRRPRTLGELAEHTGLSKPGVLKHLQKLQELGLVEESTLKVKGLSARKLYAAKGVRIGDFSEGNVTVVKVSEDSTERIEDKAAEDLEYLADEVLIERRRVRSQARKLGRMIDELVDDEERLSGALESLPISEEDRLILRTLYTEENIEDGERILSRHLGLKDPRKSIEKALAKARRSAKK